MNSLPQIKDIHIPEGVSVFPLAYGWWIIIFIIILTIVVIKVLHWIYKKSKKYYALKQIKKIDIEQQITAAIELSNLLRRVCNIKFKHASTLYGQDWINFLNSKSKAKLSQKEANLLLYAPFIDKTNNDIDVSTINNLKLFCKNWIGENL